MKKEKIIDNLAFVVGTITVLLAVALKDNLVLMGIVAGSGAIVFGILKAINKNNVGYVFLSIGSGLVLALSLYKGEVLEKPDSLTFMICASTFLLMFVTFIFDYLNRKEIFKVYKLKVEAEVIDLVLNPNTNKEYYQVIYGYEIDGKYYQVGTPGYNDKFIPKLGDQLTIYVEENDHESVYFDKDKKEKIYDTLLGLFLMVASLVIMITLFIR